MQDLQSKELPTTRIQPDRRWFGNTRVIGQKQLEQFREEMSSKINDSYTVLLREKKLPLQLLEDPERKVGGKQKRADLLGTQPFADTFGPNRKRKKPKLSVEGYADLVQTAVQSEEQFESKAGAGPQGVFDEFKDAVSTGRIKLASNLAVLCASDAAVYAELWLLDGPAILASAGLDLCLDVCNGAAVAPTTSEPVIAWLLMQARDAIFDKGQSKRIWGELYKVLDSSDVVIQVLDARDPEGTRCKFLEQHIRKNARHKHLLLLLNKCDLVSSSLNRACVASSPSSAVHIVCLSSMARLITNQGILVSNC